MQSHSFPAFSAMSEPARVIWAKSGEGHGHGLLAHMLDAAAVCEALLAREPRSSLDWAASQFGLPVESVGRWLAAIVGLHDFGKAIPGFQGKWPEGELADKACGLGFHSSLVEITDHACATAALLGKELSRLSEAEQEWVRHVLQAISAHHGYHFSRAEVERARLAGKGTGWNEARREILDAYWATLSPSGTPSQDALTTPAVNWLAGLTSVADWVASNPDWFPLGERRDGFRDYYQYALELASSALEKIGWSRANPLLQEPADTPALLGRITGRGQSLLPRPLQEVGDRLLSQSTGPSLLLVEAPMGEGKTELAFLAHLRLQAINGHRGLYVAMPTQATGNALFKRALDFLGGFAKDRMDVQLIHGGAAMNADVQHLRGIDHSRDASLSASAWFSQRRRPLLSPYGVGTVDQALFAALNVKHHFVRLWGLSNRVVVLDEVHAYDTYTSGLIDALLQWLKALGSSVVLMSATLPRARRDELLRVWGVESESAVGMGYPRVLIADAHGLRKEHFPARPMPAIRLRGLGHDLDALADRAAALVAGSGCGAAIVNTVERAQKLYLALRERCGESVRLLLFHARFPACRREAIERDVLALFGASGKRPVRALLIATQVAEQSLDLDFDFMLSDLAPVDLLLQRLGRLHRHDRERPPQHAEACLHVAGLQPGLLPELKETGWGFVYEPYILGRTWALLSKEELLHLPEDIDRLVQAVYGEALLPDDLEGKARSFIEIESYGEYRAGINMERMLSLNVAIDPSSEPQNAYANKPRGNEEGDGIGLTNRTRLGQDSVTLVPIELHEKGWKVHGDGDGVPFLPHQAMDDLLAARLLASQIKVSQRAMVAHFKGMELPTAFSEHPLLRGAYPLLLSNGEYESDGFRMRLDEELGLVVEKKSEV